MADFKEDTKQNFKEGLRERVEQNTGIVGNALRERREQKEKEKLIHEEVVVIQQITTKMKMGGTTLTNMERSFTQISENLQLISKAFKAQSTTFEETQAAYQPQAAIQSKKQAAPIQKIAADTEEVSLFDRVSALIDGFETARLVYKGARAAAAIARGVGKKGAEVAGKVVGKEVGKKASKAAIKASARKILLKSLGKLVGKSIPIVGAAVGIGFAIGRLIEGDYVGAGLEAGSGLAGPITSVPFAISSAVRDVYFETYGVQYENDPLRDERLKEVQDAVGEEARDILKRNIETTKPATTPTPVAAPAPSAGPAAAPPPTLAAPSAPTVSVPSAPPTTTVGKPSAPTPTPAPTPVAAPPTAVTAPPMAGPAGAKTKPAGAPKTASGGEIAMEQALKDQGFEPTAIAAIMAQTSHESGHFKFLEENLNYSASGLTSIFGKYFNADTAAQYAKQPEKIANKVYANRMGNGPEESGDGYKYRGRGFIQLTGKVNYAAAGQSLGLDLTNNPNLAAEPKNAANIAIWYFKKNIKRITNWADTLNITKIVNGGTIGLADRQKEFDSYLAKYTGGATAVAGTDASAGKELAQKSTEVAGAKKSLQAGSSVTVIAINNNTQTKVGATNRPPQSQTTAVVGA